MHHDQEREALLIMVRVSASRSEAETRLIRKVQTQILHHLQEREALLQMMWVWAARSAAQTRLLRKVQDVS